MKSANDRNDRLRRLEDVVKSKRKILIMVHDNPDPDALASAIGFKYLLQNMWKISSVISYGGIIGRAENRAMIKLLNIDIVSFQKIHLKDFRIVALIDTQPGSGNNSLPDACIPDIIIDHHIPVYEKSKHAAFSDIRTSYGSTSTMITEYLNSAGILGNNKKIATALLYGIKSDTRDLGRETGVNDMAAYLRLYPLVLFRVLSRIEYPKLSKSYFRVISRAINRALIYKDVIIADIGKIESADNLAEMSDFLIRVDDAKWALCMGEFNGNLYFSLRATNRKANAGLLAKKMTRKKGSGGGHSMVAGGRIPLFEDYQEKADLLKAEFLKEIKRQYFKGELLIGPSTDCNKES
jgi:nanoRNase/pAp phosphatase (c-di-AMP/oligoRNAs hydrolase)